MGNGEILYTNKIHRILKMLFLYLRSVLLHRFSYRRVEQDIMASDIEFEKGIGDSVEEKKKVGADVNPVVVEDGVPTPNQRGYVATTPEEVALNKAVKLSRTTARLHCRTFGMRLRTGEKLQSAAISVQRC